MLCSRCSYQTALHKGVTTALRATAGFVYSITHTHTHTHAHTPTHTLPLFCISQIIVPIEPKFCMHMECDQSIKSHKNIKLIWGHLGYANEGQRSNLPLFCISETVGPIEPKFCMRMECDQTIKSHKNINLIWGHLGYANEGQRSNLPLFCISLTGDQFSPRFWYVVAERQFSTRYMTFIFHFDDVITVKFSISGTVGPIEPKFCMHMECDQAIISWNNTNLLGRHLRGVN